MPTKKDNWSYLEDLGSKELRDISKQNGIQINKSIEVIASRQGYKAANGDIDARVVVDNNKEQIRYSKQSNQRIAGILSDRKGEKIPETTSPKYGYIRAGTRLQKLDKRGGPSNERAVKYISHALKSTAINDTDRDLVKEKLKDGFSDGYDRYESKAVQGRSGRNY